MTEKYKDNEDDNGAKNKDDNMNNIDNGDSWLINKQKSFFIVSFPIILMSKQNKKTCANNLSYLQPGSFPYIKG